MAKYYKWYKREEEVLRKHKNIFMFAIRTPEHGFSGNTWAYVSLQTSDDKLEHIWINIMLSKPERLSFLHATKKDEEYIGRYLKGNKGKIIIEYFDVFGPN